MDEGRRRTGGRNSVVAGSVWESRMKSDEVKGGIKVFNGEENSEEGGGEGGGVQANRRSKRIQTGGVSGKRKTWKSESFEGFDRSPIQIAKGRSDQSLKNCDEQCKELSVSVDGGIKKSAIQARKARSEAGRDLSVSVDGLERSPIQQRKARSESHKGSEVAHESVDGSERNSLQLRKAKSESNKAIHESTKSVDGFVEGIQKSPVGLRKAKSESNKVIDESSKGVDGCVEGIEKNPIGLRKPKLESNKVIDESGECVEEIETNPIGLGKPKLESNKVIDESGECVKEIETIPIGVMNAESELNKATDESSEAVERCVGGIEKNPIEIKKSGSDETCKEFGVCQEKVISSSLGNVGQVSSTPEILGTDDDDDGLDDDEEYEGGEGEEFVDEEIEIEIEKKSFDVKEINVPEQKPNKVVNEEKKLHQIHEKRIPISSVVNKQPQKVMNEEKKLHQIHEKPIPIPSIVNKQPQKVVREEKRLHQIPEKPIRISSTVNKQPPPVVKHSTIYRNLSKPASNFTKYTPSPRSYESQRIPETQNKLQNLVDLVMWREVSKSAFVFGIGTFLIISSSYTKDLNISLISVISYLGLVYLALIFLYRSLICRAAIDVDDSSQDYVVGEEEAFWILKLVLPYLNEFLLKLRALFCGDPATTMKLAVVLFVLARGGSSITIWKMAKLGFFGVFTVPKVCSSYSTQLTGYGKFWVQRFRDAWESCSHKKAVAAAIFTLVWNLSSIVARIWAVFILFVAVRYYQESMVSDDWVEDETDTWQGEIGEQRQGRGPTIAEVTKEKKGF